MHESHTQCMRPESSVGSMQPNHSDPLSFFFYNFHIQDGGLFIEHWVFVRNDTKLTEHAQCNNMISQTLTTHNFVNFS